jgi:hypothetical protein
MDRREFVAALVAAGAVCAGLNIGCNKTETAPEKSASNTNTNSNSAREAETTGNSNNPAVDNSGANAPSEKAGIKKSKPVDKAPRAKPAEPGPAVEPETVTNSNKPRHKPIDDNPAGPDISECYCKKTNTNVDCCWDEKKRKYVPCPCPF